jgi:molybdopterin-synthase adenylyltransferase
VRTLRYVELHEAKILIAGARALGAATAAHLAAAGVGYLALADGGTADGFNRAEILAARLAMLQPDLQVDTYPIALEEANAVAIATGHDAAIDATGDDEAGNLLARAGAELGISVVHITRGAVLNTRPGQTACFGCAKAGAGAFPEGNISVPVGNASVTAGAERSLLAGLLGAVAAADLELALREPPADALLRIVRVPPEIETRRVERDLACDVCAAIPERAR